MLKRLELNQPPLESPPPMPMAGFRLSKELIVWFVFHHLIPNLAVTHPLQV